MSDRCRSDIDLTRTDIVYKSPILIDSRGVKSHATLCECVYEFWRHAYNVCAICTRDTTSYCDKPQPLYDLHEFFATRSRLCSELSRCGSNSSPLKSNSGRNFLSLSGTRVRRENPSQNARGFDSSLESQIKTPFVNEKLEVRRKFG